MTRRQWMIVLAITALPRLVLLFLNENYFGDAVVRSEFGGRWAAHPRFIGSFAQGVWQFGPLHIYLIGIATKLWGAREHVGRVVSFIVGVATVVPLSLLTRRLFGERAALWAAFGFACWGMQLQFSTTAGSEALGIFLVVCVVNAFSRAVLEGHRGSLFAAAFWLNLACATRYDAWLWIPMLCGVLALRRQWRWAFVFGALCCAFPLGWMYGNAGDLGNPLYPFKFIDDFHRNWFPDGDAYWGVASYRLQNLVFWPAVAVVTLTPLFAAASFVGLVRSWKARPELRWLVVLIVLPTVIFTLRSTLLASFVPLARFTVKEVVLLLPFAGWLLAEWKWARIPAAATAIVIPLVLAVFCFHREGKWEDTLRPISPTSTQPRAVMEVARQVQQWKEPLLLDSDPRWYHDVTIGFFSGLPEGQLARFRWEDFSGHVESVAPKVLVRIDGGGVEKVVQFTEETAQFRAWTFKRVPGFAAPFAVYRRD